MMSSPNLKLKNMKTSVFDFARVDFMYLILIWALFTSTGPFEFYSVIPHHPYKFLTFLIAVIMLIRLSKNYLDLSEGRLVIFIIIAHFYYSIFSPFIHAASLSSYDLEDGELYYKLSIQLIVDLILYLYITRFYSIHKVAVSFVSIMTVMALLGMLVVLLVYGANLRHFSEVSDPQYRQLYNYILTFALYASEGPGSIIRSSGYFDEPGTFAFYITVALLINKMYDYSRRAEWMLIVFGLCTLSLAFFISIFLYILIFGLIEGRIKTLLVATVIIGSTIFTIDAYRESSDVAEVIYDLTIYRLPNENIGENQVTSNSNRAENMVNAMQAFFEAPLFGHGSSAHTNQKNEYVGKLCCNPFHPLATEGIIGTIIFFFLYLYWGIHTIRQKKIDLVSAGAWFIIFVNLLQRPGFVSGTLGYFVFIFLWEASKWRKMQQKPSFSTVG